MAYPEGGPKRFSLSLSLNFIRSIILDQSFGEIISMPCRTAEAIMAADSINATSAIACFCRSDCKVVVIFSPLANLILERTS